MIQYSMRLPKAAEFLNDFFVAMGVLCGLTSSPLARAGFKARVRVRRHVMSRFAYDASRAC